MAYDIGTARGVVEMKYEGDGVDEAIKDQERLQDGSKKSGKSLDAAGRMAGRAGFVIAGGLAAGVLAAANFESRMSAIKAVSGATSSEMDKLSDKALQLGQDTQFSAGESAQAMEELIKAGLSVDDVLNGAADATVNLAAAGAVDMPTAANIASNAMNQFNLNAEDMVGVVDSIAGAANSSAIDVADFGQSLGQVGAVANLAGVSFDDTATAIAIMGNAGIKGSDAGTSLKSMFARLQPTTKKQSELFKKLGIITEDGSNKFYDAQGNLKGLGKVSGVLQDSLKGMTKQQKQATLQTLFGSDAIRAAAVLSDKGAKGFDKMANSMKKTSAADVAKTRMDNFKGSIEQMMGSLETLGITLGTILLPALRKVVDQVTKAVNWFGQLGSGTQTAIVAGLAFVAAALLIFAAIVKISRAVVVINGALTVLRGTMVATWLAALGPIALVIAAIALIVAAIVILWKKSETFRNIVTAVWNAIKKAAQAVGNWFKGPFINFFKTAWDKIKSGLSAVKNFFTSAWNAIKNGVRNAWNAIKSAVSTGVNAVKTVITNVINGIKSFLTGAWNTIKDGAKEVWEKIKEGFKTALEAVMNYFKNAPGNIKRNLGNLGSLLISAGEDLIRGLIDGIKNMASAVVDAAMGVAKGAKDAVTGFFKIGSPSKVMEKIGEWFVKGFVKGIVGTRAEVNEAFAAVLGKLREDNRKHLIKMVKDSREHMLRVAKNYEKVSNALAKARDELRSLRDEAKAYAAQVEDAIKETGDITNAVPLEDAQGNPLPVTFADIVKFLTKSVDQAAEFSKVLADLKAAGLNSAALDQIVQAGPEAGLATAQALLAAGAEGITQVNSLQDALAAHATTIASTAKESMYRVGLDAAQGLVDGLEARQGRIEQKMKEIARALIKAIKKELGIKSPSKEAIWLGEMVGQGFANGIAAMEGQVAKSSGVLTTAMARAVGDPALGAAFAAAQAGVGARVPSSLAGIAAGVGPSPVLAGGPSGQPAVSVRVFIGDKELTDQVRIVVGETLDPLTVLTRQGAL